MQQESHVDEFVQAAINVACCTGHAITGDELRSLDPVEDDLIAQAALHLPTCVAPIGTEWPPRAQRMPSNELECRLTTYQLLRHSRVAGRAAVFGAGWRCAAGRG